MQSQKKISMKFIQCVIAALCVSAVTVITGCHHGDPAVPYNYTLIPFENENGLFGYMETDGDIVIKPQFEEASAFSNELARVKIDGEYGYINEDGKVVIPAIYTDGTSFRNNLAFVKAKENHYICITPEGRMKFEMEDCKAIRPFSGNMAAFCSVLNKWGYVNVSGEIIFIPTFDKASDFHEGVAAVQMHGLWGLVNEKGQFVVEPVYKSLGFESFTSNE